MSQTTKFLFTTPVSGVVNTSWGGVVHPLDNLPSTQSKHWTLTAHEPDRVFDASPMRPATRQRSSECLTNSLWGAALRGVLQEAHVSLIQSAEYLFRTTIPDFISRNIPSQFGSPDFSGFMKNPRLLESSEIILGESRSLPFV